MNMSKQLHVFRTRFILGLSRTLGSVASLNMHPTKWNKYNAGFHKTVSTTYLCLCDSFFFTIMWKHQNIIKIKGLSIKRILACRLGKKELTSWHHLMSVYKHTFDIQFHFQYFWCTLCISVLSVKRKKNGPLKRFVPACLDETKTHIITITFSNSALKKNKKQASELSDSGWVMNGCIHILSSLWLHLMPSHLVSAESPANWAHGLQRILASSPRLASWRWFYGTDRRWGLAECFPGSLASLASPH